MRSTSARERWLPIVRDLEASGLTAAAFARQRGLKKSTLGWWRARFRREQREAFIEVAVQEARTEPSVDRLNLWLQDGRVRVVVDEHTNLDLLRSAVAALC